MVGLTVGSLHGAVTFFNSPNFSDAGTFRDSWLAALGVSAPTHSVDFESGFTDGQNISGVSGLFPGGLVISDSTPSNAAIIGTGSVFGGSNPVGNFGLSHNEGAFLVLDFSASPVDYFSFRDIDTTSTNIRVNFVGGGFETVSSETTGGSGDSAEFVGVFRNDQPRIESVQLDANGDGTWGIDNVEYGVVPEPSVILLGVLGLPGFIFRRRR